MSYAKKILGYKGILYLGNVNSKRDWGHAKDYVEMQWRILQQKKPDDFVIATGKQASVREFIELITEYLNWGKIEWEGEGINEIGRRPDNGDVVVRINPKLFRPAEVDTLLGNPIKAKKILDWEPTTTLQELAIEMISDDLENAKKEYFLKNKTIQ